MYAVRQILASPKPVDFRGAGQMQHNIRSGYLSQVARVDASSPAQDKGLDRPVRKIFSRGAIVSVSGRLLVAGARRIR